MRSWVRNLLVLPLVVGVVVAGFSFGLPRIFAAKKELSYTIDGPIHYLEDPALGHVEVQVNGIKVLAVVAYKVRVWNSGSQAVKNLPIRFVFETDDEIFRIFNVNHSTSPRYEFGDIVEAEANAVSRRFIYSLLNPGDSDTLTFLANAGPPLALFSKAEDLSVKRVEASEPGRLDGWPVILISLVAGVGSLISSLIVAVQSRLAGVATARIRKHFE